MRIYQFSQRFLWVFSSLFLLANCRNADTIRYDNGAISPDKALATFEVESGFKIEMIASEPLVFDPVDMEIDEYDRLYVVEMPGYPLDRSGEYRVLYPGLRDWRETALAGGIEGV